MSAVIYYAQVTYYFYVLVFMSSYGREDGAFLELEHFKKPPSINERTFSTANSNTNESQLFLFRFASIEGTIMRTF